MESILDGNDLIRQAIKDSKPFIAGKMGAVEQQVMIYNLYNINPDDNLKWHQQLFIIILYLSWFLIIIVSIWRNNNLLIFSIIKIYLQI